MLSKQDILKILNDFPYDKNEYCIFGSSALTLYGIKEFARDVDIVCTSQLFDKITNEGKFAVTETEIKGARRLEYDENIEIIDNSELISETSIANGYNVTSLNNIKQFKLKRGKEKDIIDVAAIDKYIMKEKQNEY